MTKPVNRRALAERATRPRRRKPYTGENPITPEELLQFRKQIDYTQADAAAPFNVHGNTWARWERGDVSFPHPAMLRYAMTQFLQDVQFGNVYRKDYRREPLTVEEWRLLRERLGMSLAEFGRLLDANYSTAEGWESGRIVFPHPNMVRLAMMQIFRLRKLPTPKI